MPTNFSRDRNFPVIRDYKAQSDVPAMMRRYSAHSVGIGPKWVNGQMTDRVALTFYVTAKRDEAELAVSERIPSYFEHVADFSGRRRRVPTDVVVSPPADFEPDPTDRFRPVPGGVSVGIPGSTGTLGGWVWDDTDDSIVLLSNEHVLGTTAGTNITQPGSFVDGGSDPADKIGDVKRGVPRVNPGTNTVDCSIGEPDDSDVYDLEVLEIGPAVYATDEAEVDMLVEKYGRTTEHTYGQIISVNYSTTLTSGFYFEDCIRIEPVSPSSDWSDSGDSGSLVFSQTPTTEGGTIKPVVGLHFAGGGIYGVACKIQNVFDELDLNTLCAGALSAFLDNLGRSEALIAEEALSSSQADEAVSLTRSPVTVRDLRRFLPSVAPSTPGLAVFEPKLRRQIKALNPKRGLSRDVQARLRGTRAGRRLTTGIDEHRGELLTLLIKSGDVRRATISALTPLVADAVTTDDVLGRALGAEDADRFERLADTVERIGSDDLSRLVAEFRPLMKRAKGATVGELFGLKD